MTYFKVILITFNIFFAKFKNYYQNLISFLDPYDFTKLKQLIFPLNFQAFCQRTENQILIEMRCWMEWKEMDSNNKKSPRRKARASLNVFTTE